MCHHAPDQRFLGREIVVQRRDVQADACRHFARSQSLETTLGNLVEGGLDERLLALFFVGPNTMSGWAHWTFN